MRQLYLLSNLSRHAADAVKVWAHVPTAHALFLVEDV
jgi:hypothetical protein